MLWPPYSAGNALQTDDQSLKHKVNRCVLSKVAKLQSFQAHDVYLFKSTAPQHSSIQHCGACGSKELLSYIDSQALDDHASVYMSDCKEYLQHITERRHQPRPR